MHNLYDLNDITNPKMGYKLNDNPYFKLVRNYIERKGFSTKLFDEHLESLVLGNDMNTEKKRDYSRYDPLFDRIDGKTEGSCFIHELFHMSSNNDETKCIGLMTEDGLGESINEGLTDTLTSSVDNSHFIEYVFESQFLDDLLFMYPDIINDAIECYFEANPSKFFNLFKEDKQVVISAVTELDKYTRGKTENELLDMKNKSNEKIPSMELFEHLINAYSIMINKYKTMNQEDAAEIADNFKLLVEENIGEKYVNQVIEIFDNKVGKEKSL